MWIFNFSGLLISNGFKVPFFIVPFDESGHVFIVNRSHGRGHSFGRTAQFKATAAAFAT